jgi:DHA2 family multidrug resistance protein
MFGLFFGNIVLTPLWLQKQMQYTATWAGYATAPMGILAVATSPIIGRLLPKADPRWLVSFGMGMLALSFFMRAQETTQADFWSVAFPMLVLGAGIPACIITLTSLGVSDLSDDKIAPGAGLQNFLRVMSMAIGATLTQTYVEHMGKFSRSELVNAIAPGTEQAVAGGANALGIHSGRSAIVFSKMIDDQAAMLATNDYYAVATLLMLAAIGLIWFAKRPKGPLKKVTH